MSKILILEFNLSKGTSPRRGHDIPGTKQLAEEYGQYYTRWIPGEGLLINPPWEPISSTEADMITNKYNMVRGMAQARRLLALNAPTEHTEEE